MCCFVEVGMFVFGIITLVKGRFQLSRTKVVVGAPAYAIGAILTAVLPVALMIGVIVGLAVFAQAGAAPGEGINAQQRIAYGSVDAGVVLVALVAVMAIAFATAKEAAKKPRATPFGAGSLPPTAPPDPNNPYSAPQSDQRDRLLDDLQ
ncbi:MAG TPA: hypothetical protein VF306_16450 [Pirellulales bacterium]